MEGTTRGYALPKAGCGHTPNLCRAVRHTTMANSSPNPDNDSGTTDELTDEHGRLPKEECAESLEEVGQSVAEGDWFPHGRCQSLRQGCDSLAEALRADDATEIQKACDSLLTTLMEALGDVNRTTVADAPEAIKTLQQTLALVIDASAHTEEPSAE